MSSFTEPLIVEKLPSGKWRTARSFVYCVGGEESNDGIYVPVGFETDFASVPRGLWNLCPPDGPYSQAAVLHDYLYQKHLRPRDECDAIFLEAMGVLGVPDWKRYIMYFCVRLFGGLFW